ncbi:hypothetical protein DEAC_c24340 [Desulfosporosinus acididurans]|uniref:Uncharacterized protein n=1 Tax=Desulfosporosinus acididurans TaxID=476652 RepID=A0A0J1FQN0_9FIRM|nr:hypothetical protein DEAC_c24340 [Desulfosporosinus acididurans]
MFLFPAFISPLEFGIISPIVVIPVALIIVVVWYVRKLNSIDKTLKEILKVITSRQS